MRIGNSKLLLASLLLVTVFAAAAAIVLAVPVVQYLSNVSVATTSDSTVFNLTLTGAAEDVITVLVNYSVFSPSVPTNIICGSGFAQGAAAPSGTINCSNVTAPTTLVVGQWINITFIQTAPSAPNTTASQYGLSVNMSNSTGDWASNVTYIKVNDNDAPSIYLSSPANSATSAANVTFQYTVTDNSNIHGSCYVYGNFSGAWARNQTNQTAVGSGTNNINVTLTDGIYIWNVNCSDSSGNSAFNATNRTLTVDATPPGITASGPTVTQTSGSVTLTATTNESATCKYDTTYTTNYSAMASTFLSTGSTSHSNALSLSNGNYNYYVLCSDAVNNMMTTTTNISFSVSISTGGSSGGSGGSGAASAIGVVAKLDDKGEFYSTSVRESNSVSYYFGGENHTIKVADVLNDSVILTIWSTPYNITLAIGETKNADLNGDGVNDLAIKFTGISEGINANLEFTKLAPPTTPPVVTTPSGALVCNATRPSDTDWSVCRLGTQTRTAYECTTTGWQSKTESRTCPVTQNPSTLPVVVIIIGAAMLVVAWWWLQERPEPYHYRHKKD